MSTTKTTYSPTFQKYLNNTFNPAQDWALSTEGNEWIRTNIPSLKKLIDKNYNDCLFAVYCIRINGTPLYVGESVRTVRRLCVHAYNLCNFPTLFGLEKENLGSNNISVELLETAIYGDNLRKATEWHYISTLKPLLQKSDGSDSCIPKRARGNTILPYLNKGV